MIFLAYYPDGTIRHLHQDIGDLVIRADFPGCKSATFDESQVDSDILLHPTDWQVLTLDDKSITIIKRSGV